MHGLPPPPGLAAPRQAAPAHAFGARVGTALEGVNVQREQPEPEGPYERRELLGVHKQPDGAFRVGVHVPTGRLAPEEARQIATLADKYSGGEIRLTVEQNMLLPNVDAANLEASPWRRIGLK